MKAPLIHVASLIFNEPLAILPSKLDAILHAVGSRLVLDEAALEELLRPSAADALTGTRPVIVDDGIPLVEAQGQNGNGENGKPYRLTPEGIAVIPIRGTLMKRFSFLTSVSGFSSYAGLAESAQTALADPQVKAVLFDVDSPGGTTHGCFELSDALYRMRGDKPMWAVANDLAASAAYALASAADRIWVTRTAGVGSIGVFALHADQSAQDERIGLKYTYIFAGEKKIDGNPHEALSKSARSDIQAEVDRENDIFLATVARNRGFAGANLTQIAATRAGIYFAENGLPLLADQVGTYDEALAALTARVNGPRISSQVPAALASETEPGNNARESKAEEVKPEGDAAMPKPGNEETQNARTDAQEAAALAAAGKRDDQDTDDEPRDAKGKAKGSKACPDCGGTGTDDGEACGTCGGTGKVDSEGKAFRRAPVAAMPTAADNPAKRIAEMCQIAGAPELAADYIVRGYSLDKVIEKLNARRTKASTEGGVNSYVAGDVGGAGAGGRASVDAAIEQARVMAANSGGRLTQSQCMEKVLRSNPEVYSNYLEERGAVAAQVAFTGGGRALTDYVLNHQRRYMANLGLGTAIEDVPGRRPM